MSYLNKIQGGGDKDADVYKNTVIKCKDYATADKDQIVGFTSLPVATARYYFMLFKPVSNPFHAIFRSSDGNPSAGNVGNIVGLYPNRLVLQLRSTSSSYIQGDTTSNLHNGKWNSAVMYYDGNPTPNNIQGWVNGRKEVISKVTSGVPIVDYTAISTMLGGQDVVVGQSYEGELAIFAIYTGAVTSPMITEFNTDPFGFIDRLKATNQSDFHLLANLNRTTGDELIDEGNNSYTITATPQGNKIFVPFS